MNFAKIFLATATLMVASIGPSFADSINATHDQPTPLPATNDKVEIVGVDYAGSGCPLEKPSSPPSARVRVSPDGQELSILFNEFKTFGNRGPEEARKNCDLTIPIRIPEGRQISIFTANYRGSVDENTTAKLRVEYFFAGQRGLVFAEDLKGEIDYNVEHKFLGEIWSACSDSGVNMRVNASMRAKGNGMATVDTLDLKSESDRGLVYKIKYRQCNNK